MKRILMVAFMAMAANFVVAQVKTDTLPQVRKSGILYVVDGVVASKSTYDKLGPDDIENITVLRNIEKVMVINTKAAYDSVKVLRVYRARVTDPSGDSGEVEVVYDKNNNIISMGKFVPDSTIKTHKPTLHSVRFYAGQSYTTHQNWQRSFTGYKTNNSSSSDTYRLGQPSITCHPIIGTPPFASLQPSIAQKPYN